MLCQKWNFELSPCNHNLIWNLYYTNLLKIHICHFSLVWKRLIQRFFNLNSYFYLKKDKWKSSIKKLFPSSRWKDNFFQSHKRRLKQQWCDKGNSIGDEQVAQEQVHLQETIIIMSKHNQSRPPPCLHVILNRPYSHWQNKSHTNQFKPIYLHMNKHILWTF